MQKESVSSKRLSRKELIPIDGEKLRQELWRRGYHSFTDQAAALGTNEKRLRTAFRGGAYQQATIVRWCERIKLDPNEIILDTAIIGRLGKRLGQNRVVGDWEAIDELTRWVEATNGLQYRIFKLAHCHLNDGRLARGKLYDLAGFPDKEREELVELLQRHPTVCQQIGPHPNIASNLTALPDVNGRDWWVVDQWLGGKSLKEHLSDEPLSASLLSPVMRGIAEGLAAFHRNGVLRRELSPRFVILDEKSNRPVLTDFELAKLLTGGPTVANEADWRHVEDPYRAPEVSANSSDLGPEIDVYSWGRILLRAATGELPDPGSDSEAALILKLPKAIRTVAAASVAIYRSKRPQSMEEVLQAIRGWK